MQDAPPPVGNEPFDTADKIWIPPETTPGCEINISNGGSIVTASGSRGTFGGNAKAELDGTTKGEEEYQDHSSLFPINFHSIEILAVVCRGDTEADIFGTGEVNGVGPQNFRIRVRDGGEPGTGVDTYQIIVVPRISERAQKLLQKAREACPNHVICAGNVVTGEMVEELILSGADIVKVGIGPGSVCTTRVKTGVGYPQLSAVIECADAAHGLGGQIVSDGGCSVPGDVAKAFGGGADFVMLGGMLAGHDECEGTVVEENGEKFMLFYGMSSESAMKRHVGGVAEYRAAEGKTVKLPLRGEVEFTVRDILGGLRSACTYVGAERLKELTKRTTFIRVAEQENRVFGSK